MPEKTVIQELHKHLKKPGENALLVAELQIPCAEDTGHMHRIPSVPPVAFPVKNTKELDNVKPALVAMASKILAGKEYTGLAKILVWCCSPEEFQTFEPILECEMQTTAVSLDSLFVRFGPANGFDDLMSATGFFIASPSPN